MARVICVICGNGANPDHRSCAKEVIGWVSPRQSGGANHIRYQEPTGRHAHVACLGEEKQPVKAKQQEMF